MTNVHRVYNDGERLGSPSPSPFTMSSFFRGKRILITGGTGSIGSEIVRQVLEHKPEVVRIFSRDEHKQFLAQQALAAYPNVRYLLGDVRDTARLQNAMEGIDIVFHAAAYKHVPSCEYNSFEAVKTNVIGTQNVIDAALNQGVERVLLVSTDKAVSPQNVMGATKLLAEKLMTSAMHSKGARKTLFSSVRFGNVLGSRGSVIPTFLRQIANGGPLTVTHPDMLRFFMSIPQAADLTLRAMESMQGGEVFILKMPVVRLEDLVDVLIEKGSPLYGKDPATIEKKITGMRPGEKAEEILMTEDEARWADDRDGMFVVHALHNLQGEDFPEVKPKENAPGFDSSDAKPLSKQEIGALIEELLKEIAQDALTKVSEEKA